MELGRCLKPVDAIIIVMVLILHVNGGLSLGYRHANVTTRCLEREREALLAIKGDLVDVYNNMLSSWGDAQNQQDCCTWKGVFCDNHSGHVVQLRLGGGWIEDGYTHYYRQLQGTLSPKLAELHHLTYLDLGNNDFSWSLIPSFIGSLTNLRYLDLSRSSFVNNYSFIGSLTNLRYLNLSRSSIVNNYSFIGSLTNLRYLDLSRADFGGRFSYDLLGNLTQLQYLNLRYTSDLFRPVENLNWLPPPLKYLDLSETNLSKVSDWLETINKLPNLRNLTLIYCQLPRPILSTLSHINSSNSLARVDLDRNPGVTSSILVKWLSNYNTTLVHLRLSSSQLSVIPGAFENMSSLQVLDLSSNQISGLVPNIFEKLSSLSYLDLQSNQISGLIPNVFVNMSSLQVLYLSNNPLEGWILKSFGQSCNLKYIEISNCNLHEQFFEFVQILPICAQNSLQTLKLSTNNLSGSIPNLSNFLSLETLFLDENQLSGMESIGNLPSLKELSLHNNRLSGVIPESIGNSLHTLDISFNNLTGSIPSLSNFLSLEKLDLSENQLSGMVPESIGNLSSLTYLNLSGNQLSGVISETHFSKLSELWDLDLSSNLLTFNFTSEWVPPFRLRGLGLSSCKVGPYFPKWLRTQTSLYTLDLSYAEISDVVPNWFSGLFQYSETIDLSHNQIRAFENSKLEVELRKYSRAIIHLSSNQLEGSVPLILSQASHLDLSNNKFSNITSFLCDAKVTSLRVLNLSSNHFSGELPDCWRQFVRLALLDLSNNAFSGKIPISLGSLSYMETLKLRTNKFVGELPSSLKSCTSLTVIDLGYNKLSMSVPAWLGVSFPNLVILMLQSNHFNGSVPSQLCHLSHIQILDLSLNEISGTVPRCLDNLTSLTQEGNSSLTIEHPLYYEQAPNSSYEDDATFVWKGVMSSYKSTLGLVKRIDLSSNRLTGGIPSEITRLVGLVSLNLSRNHLTGKIPQEIGKLQSLDNLDLSRNELDGKIPSSLAQIHRLSYLDLSYNHLSAEIPLGTQLQGFDPSSYAENPQLCGRPLPKMCALDQDQKKVSSHEEDRDELITQGFFISMGLGFAAGFWGVCGSLIFKRSWRYAYYKFLNGLYDWLYVRVALVRRRLKDMVNIIAK